MDSDSVHVGLGDLGFLTIPGGTAAGAQATLREAGVARLSLNLFNLLAYPNRF